MAEGGGGNIVVLLGHRAPHGRTTTQVNKAEGTARGCFVTTTKILDPPE